MDYKKRIYKSPREFFRDLYFPFKNRKRLREISHSQLVPPAFQERLMLAVTGVNDCRYCSYFHSRQALKNGISPEEISMLLAGDIDNCPPEESVALAYAQHWAESSGNPESEAEHTLVETYGEEKTKAIHLMLRMIRMGNLMGNTWDYLLYRLSFGKFNK